MTDPPTNVLTSTRTPRASHAAELPQSTRATQDPDGDELKRLEHPSNGIHGVGDGSRPSLLLGTVGTVPTVPTVLTVPAVPLPSPEGGARRDAPHKRASLHPQLQPVR